MITTKILINIEEMKLEYSKRQGITLMNSIEAKARKLMHEMYPDLEKQFWIEVDKGENRKPYKLSFVLERLAKILDELNSH